MAEDAFELGRGLQRKILVPDDQPVLVMILILHNHRVNTFPKQSRLLQNGMLGPGIFADLLLIGL